MEKFTRRELLKEGLKFGGALIAGAAIGRYVLPKQLFRPNAESTSNTTVWSDRDLLNHPDRGLIKLKSGLDIFQDPAGSVGMLISFNDTGVLRIVSEEVGPKPGYLVDKIIKHEKGDYAVHPVSPINDGDHEIVYVAILSDSEKSDYRALSYARKYDIIRTGDELKIKYLGHKLIGPPGTLPMRDKISPEAQLQQEISYYLLQQKDMITVPRDSDLVGGTWASPKEPVTPINANRSLEISAIPTSKFPIEKVVFTADYPGRISPDPENPDAWAILGFAYKPDKNGVWRIPPFDVASLGLKTGDKITISFDVVAEEPTTGKLVRKLAPNGTHVLAITN